VNHPREQPEGLSQAETISTLRRKHDAFLLRVLAASRLGVHRSFQGEGFVRTKPEWQWKQMASGGLRV